tara:strand:- start:1684 stop:1884 length:201 start_codon:yes stop_codon:yes gene_type:complete
MKKPKFRLWWFTDCNKKDERLHSKDFKTLIEAKQFIKDNQDCVFGKSIRDVVNKSFIKPSLLTKTK